METYAERCAGIDIGKANVKVCIRVPSRRAGQRRSEVRTFATTTRALLAMRDWFLQEQVTLVGMESTGQCWRPVYYLLEDVLECWLINPQHIKVVPGRKSDVSDAAWIAQLVEHGLVRPSFVPPPPIRRLRDLTRFRSSLVHDRTRQVQRLHDLLEDAGIKLSLVATDILGVSGRAMVAALIAGQRDPEQLADLALGKLKKKNAALIEALTGRFDEHHGFLAQMMLDQIDNLNAAIDRLDTKIQTALEPYRDLEKRLITIPGVGTRAAEVIIAETGGDMSRFPTPGHLSSWAGLCPGNNESAGKHFSGRTRSGNAWLCGMLGDCATAAARTKNTYIAERHRRLQRRRGRKRAKVATSRTILESAWWVMRHDVDYQDLGPEHFLTRTLNPARRAHRLVSELRALGYDVPALTTPPRTLPT
ncbi:IS110 family transposase [Ornithinimicrobium sp. Y1847]|uniref:IS110 family transposase n=1 Tax=Ornithinimicrobium sp. Y1847 TaxID=3405419 RepID=UPI003B6831D0